MFDEKSGERRDEDVRLASESLFDTAAFEQFDRSIEASLDQLVTRWLPYAAPRAKRGFASPFSRRSSAPSQDTLPDSP